MTTVVFADSLIERFRAVASPQEDWESFVREAEKLVLEHREWLAPVETGQVLAAEDSPRS